MQGYQRGAAADVTRAQQAEAARYHQQELAVRREQIAQTLQIHREELQRQRDVMKQQYEIAMKPQMHFVEQYDPQKGYNVSRAYQHNPATGELKPIDIDAADKARSEGGLGATVHTPQGPVALPPNMDLKTYNQARAKNQADIEAGKITIPQMIIRWLGKTELGQSAVGTPPSATTGEGQPKPQDYRPSYSRPRGVPPGSQVSPSTGMWKDRQGNIYDKDGNRVQ